MGLADTAKLVVDLSLAGNFTSQMNGATKAAKGFEAQIDRTGTRAFKAGQQIGTGIKNATKIAAVGIGLVASQVALGLNSLIQLEKATAQTNAVLRSTKGVSGQTADSIRKLAEEFESLNATVGDEFIQAGENLLLTFTNIQGKAFKPALAAALDLNQALGKGQEGLTDTVRILGKALNDPARGLTALQRIGITFTKQQKDQIAAALKANDTFKAQSIILAELNKRFGGSFLAGGQTTAGKVAKFKDSIEDLQRALATALLPTIGKIADKLTQFLADPKVVKAVSQLGDQIASLFSDQNLSAGADFLKGLFETAKTAAPVIQAGAKATFTLVKAAVDLFKSLPEPLQQLAVGAFAVNKLTGGLVTNVAGGIAQFLAKSFTGAMNVNAGVVNVNGGVTGGIPGAGGGGTSTLTKALSLATIVASVTAVVAEQQQQTGQNQAIATGISAGIKQQISGGASLADLQRSLDAVNQGIAELESNPLSVLVRGDALDQLKQQNANLRAAIAARTGGASTSPASLVTGLLDRGGRELGKATGKMRDDLNGVHDILAGFVAEFKGAVQDLRKARTAEQIKKAAATATGLIEKGRGSVAGTASIIAGLKQALRNTHDPKLAAILRADLAKVERKLPGRQFAAQQLAKADKLIRDGKVTNADLTKLKAIEQALKDHGLPSAAAKIGARIDAAKRAEVAASHAAGQAAAAAIKDKDLSVTVNTTVNTSVSVRDQIRREHQISRIFATAS